MATSSTWTGTLSRGKFEEDEEDKEVPAWTSPTPSQAESDGGGDGAVHDAGPGPNLQEMPRPVLREECSQEEFQSFTQQWSLYARYHSGMDVGELRQQLLNSADRPLEAAM
jgi:hypothetical protein